MFNKNFKNLIKNILYHGLKVYHRILNLLTHITTLNGMVDNLGMEIKIICMKSLK